MRRLKDNKAFTLIELIVVIAVLGILVLLAAPRFLGYTEDAKLVQIQNDVKVIENSIAVEMIENENLTSSWTTVESTKLEEYRDSDSLFDKKGTIASSHVFDEVNFIVEDRFLRSELHGTFYLGKGGKVYYYEEGFSAGENEAEEAIEYVIATDDDFIGESNRDFRYIGNDEYVEIPHRIKGIYVTSYSSMFSDTSGAITDNVKGVKSTNNKVTSMYQMFRGSQATTLDLSSFDTSSVTSMRQMFWGSQAATLDLSSFDTSKVNNMRDMFYHSQAKTLDLSSFYTSNVADMNGMFLSSQATTLDLSSFDTSSVTDMGYMFYGSQATTLDLSSFDTGSVTSMYEMFRGSEVVALDLSSFDTSSVTSMSSMFRDSKATTGLAKTEDDANRFNSSSDKPSTLNFVVK